MDPSASAAYLIRSIREITPKQTGVADEDHLRLPTKISLRVAGEGRLTLPKDSAGVLPPAESALTGPEGWPRDSAVAAVYTLLTKPTLVVPHPTPTREEAQELVGDRELMRHAKPSKVTLMLGATTNEVAATEIPAAVGFGELLVIESALAFGRSLLVEARLRWTHDLDELVSTLREVRSTMRFKDSRALPANSVLLGIPNATVADAGESRDRFKEIAAAYGVALRCLPEPGSWRTELDAWLAKYPPQVLYVSQAHAADIWPVQEKIRRCNPPPKLVTLEELTVDDLEIELAWRLAEQLGLGHDLRTREQTSIPIDWPGLKAWLEALPQSGQGEGVQVPFKVAPSALDCCAAGGYGYPHPQRILSHVKTLMTVAEHFHALGGKLPKRFDEWVRDEHGLNVAMFPRVNGRLDPHIKVDDAKHGLTQTGRIHFEIDSTIGVITLTYLGAHT